MRRIVLVVALLTGLGSMAGAVSPGTDLWLPSVGHGPGAAGSQWRTDLWVSLPGGNTAATVDIYFLPRGDANSWPAESRRITLNPGETREFEDVIKNLFGKDNAFGALRIVADKEVLATSRIYTAGLTVVTEQGNKTGTAGQFFAGLSAAAAIGLGQATEIQGLAQDTSSRTNLGWVEVRGGSCTVRLERYDGDGTLLATRDYSVGPYAVVQKNQILNELGGGAAGNQRVKVTVVSGSCGLLAFGSRLDNNTNDPSTLEMRTPTIVDRSLGTFAGAVYNGTTVVGGLSFQLSAGGVGGLTGVGSIDCGGVPYTLDFGPNATPVVPDEGGTFSLALTHDYYDGSTRVFTVTWSVGGQLPGDGTATGIVQSTVSNQASGWTTCTGLIHNWKAGWVDP